MNRLFKCDSVTLLGTSTNLTGPVCRSAGPWTPIYIYIGLSGRSVGMASVADTSLSVFRVLCCVCSTSLQQRAYDDVFRRAGALKVQVLENTSTSPQRRKTPVRTI